MSRLSGLDLLRALAIAWVMMFHLYIAGGLVADFGWFAGYGWMGVDLFFVLSGYLIGSQVLAPLARGEALALGGFWRRRALRILPAYAVVLAVYLAVPAFREAPGLAPWWQFATFTLNDLIDWKRDAAFSHAWSLCVEEQFYLVFPLLAWWLTRRPSMAKFATLCAVVVLAGIALRSGIWWAELSPARGDVFHGRGFQQRFLEDLYYPTWNRLDGLLAGVALASLRAFRRAAWERWQARANGVLVVGLAAVALAMWLFRDRVGLVANAIGWPVLACGFAMLVFAGAAARSWIARWRVPGAGWLAAVSYSLYLVHKPIYHLVATEFGGGLQGHPRLALAACLGAALLGGAVLHYTIERPFLRWRERLEREHSTHTSAATLKAALPPPSGHPDGSNADAVCSLPGKAAAAERSPVSETPAWTIR